MSVEGVTEREDVQRPPVAGVIGVGSMGRHHARVYHELPDVELGGVYDVDSERAAGVAENYDTEAYDLDSLLETLAEREVDSVMVEGGTQILTSFLKQRHVNHLIATVAPTLIGGRPVLHSLAAGEEDAESPFPRIENIQYRWLGDDLILEGTPTWPD